ncbi:hypothetical protein J4G37_57015, partial [Microvirga sp. 3-52]|nr:hypothetical protein [Microvirga sp. 3-52]
TTLYEEGEYKGPPSPVEHDMAELEKLVPNVVKREIATLIDGQIRHESKEVASWLIQYMESTAGKKKM